MLDDGQPDIFTELKRKNRLQRNAARTLRRNHRLTQQHADEVFIALCDYNTARQAFWELWSRGGFGCEPEDYQEIVERCLEAIHALRLIGQTGSHIPEV